MFAEKVIPCEWAQVRWFAIGLLVAVLAHGLAFGVARAQNGCPTPSPHEAILRDHVADALTSRGFSDARSDVGVPALDSGVTKTIITDAAACNAIYAAILTNIDSMWALPAGADKSAALATQSIHYFRVGDYYAAMIVSNGGGVFALGGWADVMIFDRKSLQFKGVVRA
jgi:hypothetical protein